MAKTAEQHHDQDATVETARLILRPLQDDDAAGLAAIANDIRIASMLGTMPHPYGLEDARAFLARVAEMPADAACFAIVRKDSGEVIGTTGYGPAHGLPEGAAPETDFGYWLGVDHWGQGFATEAATAAVAHAFTVSGQTLISTDHQVTNPASRRVLEKVGFRPVGTRKRHSLGAGGWKDTVNMQLTADDWRKARS